MQRHDQKREMSLEAFSLGRANHFCHSGTKVEPKWKFKVVMQKHGETAPIADKSNDMTENKLGWF